LFSFELSSLAAYFEYDVPVTAVTTKL
jgi:hypothetical protein